MLPKAMCEPSIVDGAEFTRGYSCAGAVVGRSWRWYFIQVRKSDNVYMFRLNDQYLMTQSLVGNFLWTISSFGQNLNQFQIYNKIWCFRGW